ncbi:MFS transporter [Henriciella aquimarina]|uniref:MFS transporter n=1 Tax=Henriciella aquimarina TaxID=545261 RepID=UPI0009FE8805|nr:MFS transporter [Henriciella aquimarina]
MVATTSPPDQGQDRPDRRGAFRLLFFALLAVGAGNTMLVSAILPPLSRDLGLPDWMAGAIFSLSATMWAITSSFWGRKSNDWGRRRVAALGMLGFSVSMLLFGTFAALAISGHIKSAIVIFVCLLCSRTLFGLFGSGTNPAAQAYVADRTSRDKRTEEIASLTSGFSFGAVAGPAFAAAAGAVFGLLTSVFMISAIAAVLSLLIFTRLPEQTPPKREVGFKRSGKREGDGLWRDPRVLPYLVFAVSLSIVTGVLTQTFAFAIMDKIDVDGADAMQFTGPAYTVGAAGTLISQLVIIPRLKMTNRELMVSGALILSLGAFLIVPTREFAVLVLAQFFVGIGQGLARPGFSSGASLSVGSSLQGNVAGLVISANGMGFIVSPLFGPWTYQNVHPFAPFIGAGVMLLVMAVFARKVFPASQVVADDPDEPPEMYD